MDQDGTHSWTTPIYRVSSNDNNYTEYKYELIENCSDNYLQLYSSTEYEAKIREIKIKTESQTK